jgi:hypothetical protein
MTTDVDRLLQPGEQIRHLATIHCKPRLLILIISLALLILVESGV